MFCFVLFEKIVIEDRLIFVHERANGAYQVGPYALAHSVVQLPFVAAIALSFTLISYFMIELNQAADRFFFFLLMLFLSLYTAESLVVTISAIIPFYIIGIAMGATAYGMFMLLGGFFLKKTNIPDGWYWAHFLSFQKYSFEALMVNDFMGQNFPCEELSAGTFACFYPDLNGDGVLSGREIMTEFDYETVDKWDWIAVVAGFAIGFRILFYLLLRFCNSGKR